MVSAEQTSALCLHARMRSHEAWLALALDVLEDLHIVPLDCECDDSGLLDRDCSVVVGP